MSLQSYYNRTEFAITNDFLSDTKALMTKKELRYLQKISSSLKDTSELLEIGSFCGASAVTIARSINDKSKLNSIDTMLSSSLRDNYDTKKTFFSNLKKYGVTKKVKHFTNTSYFRSLFWTKKLDFILIDASHDYLSVKLDFLRWSKKLRKGGFLVFHDALESNNRVVDKKNQTGPTKLVKEIFENGNIYLKKDQVGALCVFEKISNSKLASFKKIDFRLIKPIIYSLFIELHISFREIIRFFEKLF